jgi:hypothetical protein
MPVSECDVTHLVLQDIYTLQLWFANNNNNGEKKGC